MNEALFSIASIADVHRLREELNSGKLITKVGLWEKVEFGKEKFPEVESLMIKECFKGDVQLNVFPSIKNIQFTDFHAKISVSGAEMCSVLTKMYLNKFNPKSKDMTPLSGFRFLEHLRVDRTTIVSLNGLEDLISLRKAELNNVRNLKDISALFKRGKQKEGSFFGIFLENGQHIDWSPFMALKEPCPLIEYLAFYNLNDIPSIEFIGNLPSLKRLAINNMDILDGNVRVGENLKWFSFDRRSHYNMSPRKDT